MLRLELLALLLLCCFLLTIGALLHFLPPPLSVNCSNSQHRVYQKHDNELRISCFWEKKIYVMYSRSPELALKTKGLKPFEQTPPHCLWYQDSILIENTHGWSGQVAVKTSLVGRGPHPPWAYIHITLQCASLACLAPECGHHNLSIEIAKQDIRLFLLTPQTLPIREWQPVRLGWCARLKSATWSYRFRSEGSSPSDLLIPSNQHSNPPAPGLYPYGELQHTCASYYSYHITVSYHHHGFYTATLHIENGPRLSRSLGLYIHPILLHVFSTFSTFLRLPHMPIHLSWALKPLSSGITAYTLADVEGLEGWTHAHSYNPFALKSDFCAAPKLQNLKAHIYFCTREGTSEELTGGIDFSNETLIFRAGNIRPTSLTLNPREVKAGVYIFSHVLGLYYSIQDGDINGNSSEDYSTHYIFHQQQSLCHLITLEFVHSILFKISVQVYLDRRETLFRSLGKTDLEVRVYNGHLPDQNLDYIVWFTPEQHPLLQCEWSFTLKVFDFKEEHLLWNTTYSYKHGVKRLPEFLPHLVSSSNSGPYTGFVAEVNCSRSGLARTFLRATLNSYMAKVMGPTVACQQSYCHELIAAIHKPDVSDRVLRFKRPSDINLQATAKADCRTDARMQVKWNVYSLDSPSSTPKWENPIHLNTSGVMFHIPEKVLPYGFYHINMTVTVYLPIHNITLTESDSVLLQVVRSELVAIIAGGLLRTIGVSDHYLLDASSSFDPDSADSTKGIRFTWYCTKHKMDYSTMTLSPNAKCHPNQTGLWWINSTSPVHSVEPYTFQENTEYYFFLFIEKPDKLAYAFQTIHVAPGSLPQLEVICVENCGEVVKVTKPLILAGRCLNCDKATAYLWKLLSANSKEILFDWTSKTTTGRSSPNLHINSFAFADMPNQFYILSLKVSTQGKLITDYEYSLHLSMPVQTGKCVLSPRSGIAMHTKFMIQCSGFEEKNGPLLYKVIAHSDPTEMMTTIGVQNNTFGAIAYWGHQQNISLHFLPVGTPSKKYALVIYVQVYDIHGTFSQVTLEATVYNPITQSTNIPKALHHLITWPNHFLTTFLETKDYLNVGFLTYVAASVLNSADFIPQTRYSNDNLREILLNVSAMIPMTEIYLIKQITSSICQITQHVDEINGKSQLLAIKMIKKVSEALKRFSSEVLDSEEAKILSNGIFSALSNVLAASSLEQGDITSTVLKETITVTQILADFIVQGKVSGELETMIEAKGWSIYLWKNEEREVSRTFLKRTSCKNCFYPILNHEDDSERPGDAVVSTLLYVFEENPFFWLRKTAGFHTAVVGFQMAETNSTGDTKGISPKVAEVTLAVIAGDSASFNLTVGLVKKQSKTIGGFNIEVEKLSKDIFIQILCHMEVTFNVSIYFGLNVSHPPIMSYTVFHDRPPAPHGIHSPFTECAIKAPRILCVPPPLLRSPPRGSQAKTLNISVVLESDPIVRGPTMDVVRIAVFMADCLELDGAQDMWKEDTCRLGPQTSVSKIHCICEFGAHDTATGSRQVMTSEVRFLAGRLVLTPNPLDINKVLLAEINRNPVAFLTVFFIFTAYVSGSMWAMIKDKADSKRKNKILVLTDNDPYHRVRYLVTVYTGSKLGSGTTADVFIELEGQNGISDVHHLKHMRFPTFYRAAIDNFLLTTKRDLGELLSIRVWHNNGGSSPNWYLSRVKVQNVSTKHCWLFLCRSWLGLGRGDGKILRSFTAKNIRSSLNKMDYFMIILAEDLENSHIWLSVFAQVVTGSFKRVQRASCCLMIMLTSLLFNIMFFSGEEEKAVISLQLRYLKSIYIGFVSALFSIPLELTITTMFTCAGEKPVTAQQPPKKPKVHFASLSEMLVEEDALSNWEPLDEEEAPDQSPLANTSGNNSSANNGYSAIDTRKTITNMKFLYFFEMPQLPWWCRYIAWTLVFSISVIAAVVIILYGLTYGYTTSIEWFIASMTSFAESVFLLQTLKIVVIVGISTISLKNCDDITWINMEQYQNMKVLKESLDAEERRRRHYELQAIKGTKFYEPLKEDELIVLRKKVRAQHLAFVFVKDIVCHLFYSFLILSIVYLTNPTTTFYNNRAMYDKFSLDLFKVNKLEHIYQWVTSIFVPLIHNDYHPTFLSDSWSKILGSPRMRQIRAQDTKKKCFQPNSVGNNYMIRDAHCRYEYGIDAEDQSDYLGSWSNPVSKRLSNHYSIYQGFTYQSDIDQWEYRSYGFVNSYGPGGYPIYFFPAEQRPNTTIRLDDLQKNNWLDERTWAVICELTTFNPDADLYCSIAVIFEPTNVGIINVSLSVNSYKLSVFYYEPNSLLILYGFMIYSLIFYLADEFYMLRQERFGYLKTTTNLINFAIKTISLFFILLIALKYKLSFTLLQQYLINPEEFIPFHVVSQIDQLYMMITGVLCFLLFLKPYRYYRFLYKVRLVEKTMSAAFPDFVWATFITALLFTIFASFGYLIIGQYEWRYNGLVHSFQTMVSFCFRTRAHIDKIIPERRLETLFRAVFAFTVIIIFMNLWRVLIISTYVSMKQTVFVQHSDEAEAINFVVLKIRSMWRPLTRQIPLIGESAPANNFIFGKPVAIGGHQQGLKTKEVNGRKIVYLAV